MMERPIIFSGPMVRAILEGRKTMTRRVMKPQYVFKECPYGIPGDRLWVRETWAMIFNGEGCLREEDERPCPCEGCHVEYRADTDAKYPGDWDEDEAKGNDDAPKWRPSIFMPRWASRITLEITNVRVERLREITTFDAIREGATPNTMPQGDHDPYCKIDASIRAFGQLWDSIHGKDAWNNNPWVWVIEFQRITPKPLQNIKSVRK